LRHVALFPYINEAEMDSLHLRLLMIHSAQRRNASGRVHARAPVSLDGELIGKKSREATFPAF